MTIEWTVNNEIQLFHAMTGHKPIGKYDNLISTLFTMSASFLFNDKSEQVLIYIAISIDEFYNNIIIYLCHTSIKCYN